MGEDGRAVRIGAHGGAAHRGPAGLRLRHARGRRPGRATPPRAASVHHMKLSRLPAGPGRPEEQYPCTLMPRRARRLSGGHERLQAVVGVAHDAALPDAAHAPARTAASRARAGRSAARRRRHRRQHLGQADERQVDHDQVGRVGKRRRLRRRAFTRSITVTRAILAQPPIELPVGDVHAGRPRAAPCCSRQSVNPPVEAPTSRHAPALDLDAEALQRPLELQPAARDVARRVRSRGSPTSGATSMPGFAATASARADAPRRPSRPRRRGCAISKSPRSTSSVSRRVLLPAMAKRYWRPRGRGYRGSDSL